MDDNKILQLVFAIIRIFYVNITIPDPIVWLRAPGTITRYLDLTALAVAGMLLAGQFHLVQGLSNQQVRIVISKSRSWLYSFSITKSNRN